MAVTVGGDLIGSIQDCLDDCARDTAEQIGRAWYVNARRIAPFNENRGVGDAGKPRYRNSFIRPTTTGGSGTYTTVLRNTAQHASFVEEGSGGYVSQPGKNYRFDPGITPYPGGAWYGDRWLGDGPGRFVVRGYEGRRVVERSLRTAIAFVAN